MKNRKILSAVITAAILVGSVTPVAAFAESGTSDQTTIQTPAAQAELSKAPEGYGGLTLTANAGGDVYGISLTEEQLKALKFSPEDEAIGRGDGYHAGFHVDALDAGKGAASFSYKRATKYLPDVNDATIKAIADFSVGNSTDGQFWIGFQKTWIDGTTEEKPYLAYVVEATYADSSKVYYYIAIDTREIPDDFTFDEPEGPGSCADNHTADTACPICGNYAKVTVTNITAADANGSITIKDADGADVEEAAKNDKITITVTPDEGYVLDKLEINGTAAAVTGSTYTHTMLGEATTVKATFKEIAVESVTLNKTTLSLAEGENETLTAEVLPATAKDKTVAWSSNKPEIAAVDANGKVTAVAAGTATITATCGTKTATCAVTVTAAAKPVTKIELSAAAATVAEKEKLAAPTVTYTPIDTTETKTVTWSSSDTAIAAVDASTGEVTGVKAGEATVTATFKAGITASYKVTVTAAAVALESLELNKTTASLKIDETVELTATKKPTGTTDTAAITWESDKTNIATVDANGKVTAVAAGEATITAKCGTVTATCKVTVTEPAKEDETETLAVGDQLTFIEVDTNGTRTESTVLVIPDEVAKNNAGVKVTVKAGDWTKTSELIKTCYKTVVYTAADGTKTTVSAGSEYMIAVKVTDIPDSIQTVTYSFEAANE